MVVLEHFHLLRNLHLSLLKKIPQGLNLLVGFMWGINGFLYGLIISSLIGYVLNIFYAKKELHTSFFWFLKPILPPLILSFVIVVSFNFILSYTTINSIYVLLLIKAFCFSLAYFSIAYLLKFESLQLLIDELKLLKKQRS